MNDQLTIRQISTLTGLSEHNLRYYERIGLMTPIDRNPSSRHRRYSEADVGWVSFLRCMRATGMPIAQMRRYADLVRQGPSTAGERKRLLAEHKATVEERIRELQQMASFIDRKIEYHHVLECASGETDETRRMLREFSEGIREER